MGSDSTSSVEPVKEKNPYDAYREDLQALKDAFERLKTIGKDKTLPRDYAYMYVISVIFPRFAMVQNDHTSFVGYQMKKQSELLHDMGKIEDLLNKAHQIAQDHYQGQETKTSIQGKIKSMQEDLAKTKADLNIYRQIVRLPKDSLEDTKKEIAGLQAQLDKLPPEDRVERLNILQRMSVYQKELGFQEKIKDLDDQTTLYKKYQNDPEGLAREQATKTIYEKIYKNGALANALKEFKDALNDDYKVGKKDSVLSKDDFERLNEGVHKFDQLLHNGDGTDPSATKNPLTDTYWGVKQAPGSGQTDRSFYDREEGELAKEISSTSNQTYTELKFEMNDSERFMSIWHDACSNFVSVARQIVNNEKTN